VWLFLWPPWYKKTAFSFAGSHSHKKQYLSDRSPWCFSKYVTWIQAPWNQSTGTWSNSSSTCKVVISSYFKTPVYYTVVNQDCFLLPHTENPMYLNQALCSVSLNYEEQRFVLFGNKFDSTRTHESFNTAALNLAQNTRSFSEVDSLRTGTASITQFHVCDVIL